MTISFIIPGEPIAQGRGRAMGFRRPDGSLGARVHDPKKSRNWKASAQVIMRMAMGNVPPLAGPVELRVVAWFTCPRGQWRKRTPREARWKETRPDLDNIVKAVKDAAKGVLWLDDSQVVVMHPYKCLAPQGAAPGVEISVQAAGGAVPEYPAVDLASLTLETP